MKMSVDYLTMKTEVSSLYDKWEGSYWGKKQKNKKHSTCDLDPNSLKVCYFSCIEF